MATSFKAHPTLLKDLPVDSRFVVFTQRTIHHEGDQRSRDYPGHGYGSYTEDTVQMRVFESEEELKQWVLLNGKENFKAFKLSPVSFEIETKIKVVA